MKARKLLRKKLHSDRISSCEYSRCDKTSQINPETNDETQF